jgi:hypothetical protein
MITATNTTVFDIHFPGDAAPGVAPYSARGLKGTLTPVDAAKGNDKLRRTVNGTLIDISAPQMRKYALEITGSDQAPPALDGLWLGMEVVVDSNVELAFLTGSGGPGRSMVSGSTRFEGAFTYYCPQFSMRVVDLQIERSEWDADVSWSLSLEEI